MFGEQVIGMVMWRREEKVGFEQGPWRFRTRIDFPHQGARSKEQGAWEQCGLNSANILQQVFYINDEASFSSE